MTGNVQGGGHDYSSNPASNGKTNQASDAKTPNVNKAAESQRPSRSDADFKKIASLLFHGGELGLLKMLKSWEKHDTGKFEKLSEMGVDELLDYADSGNEEEEGKSDVKAEIEELGVKLAKLGMDALIQFACKGEAGDVLEKIANMGMDELVDYIENKKSGGDIKEFLESHESINTQGQNAPQEGHSGDVNNKSNSGQSATSAYQKMMLKEIKELEAVLRYEQKELDELRALLKELGPAAVLKRIEAKLEKLVKEKKAEAMTLNLDQKKLKLSIQGFIIGNICQDAVEVLELTMDNLKHYDISVKLENALSRARDEKLNMKNEVESQRKSQDIN